MSPNWEVEKNLHCLMLSDQRPDILVLAEFNPENMHQDFLGFLKSQYPFASFVPYSKSSYWSGIQVHSRYPLNLVENSPLDWTPPGLKMEENKKRYRLQFTRLTQFADLFTRPFLHYQVELDSRKKVDFYPLHLANPWLAIGYKRWESAGYFVERFGNPLVSLDIKRHVMTELLFGQENPHYYQVSRLMGKLKTRRRPESRAEILFGDLNSIPRVQFRKSQLALAFESEGFVPTFSTEYPDKSFPTKQGESFNSLLVDQAHTRGKIQTLASEVLFFKGSDHYPIYLVLKNSQILD